MKTPFLEQVANYYASHDYLANLAFVMPNRRSSQQFARYLTGKITSSTLLPRIMSINDFIDHVNSDSNLVTASPIESLFIAYQAYCMALQENASDFDKFAFWGQLIVSDFNDIDMNMVDATALYSNLRDLRSIGTNYIEDPELVKALQSILNIDITSGDDKFWKPRLNDPIESDVSHSSNEVQQSYRDLWSAMPSIYKHYNELLASKNLTTQGKLYRNAVEIVNNAVDAQDLGFDLIVMVGHDMLSMSEMTIFNSLKKKGIAHFWWDNASPAFNNDNNLAKKTISTLASHFKMPSEIDSITEFPDITIQNVPSTIGQTKCVFTQDMPAGTTAIVLPDETLLEPLLSSMPEHFTSDDINITMSYQLRRSNIASLMHMVAVAHKHATYKSETQQYFFYREDVRDILSHPIIKMAHAMDVIRINTAIDSQREYNISEQVFAGTQLQPLFDTVCFNMQSENDVKIFIDGIEQFCNNLYNLIHDQDVDLDEVNNKNNQKMPLQCAFIKKYIGVLGQLRLAIDMVGLPLSKVTLFHLIERMTTGAIVPFGGVSGQGLQVMGVLETRALDFENLHILSVNEGTFPRQSSIQSFIPDILRRAFGMPSQSQIDAIENYRFYRLISRARNVTLYYDSSDDNRCEPSRYIMQLQKLYPAHLTHIKRTASVSSMPDIAITINEPQLKQQLAMKYTTGNPMDSNGNVPCLSASSINMFINCPLKFYFQHVKKLVDSSHDGDLMDSATFGTIVHDSLEACYNSKKGLDNQQFTRDDIENFIKNHLDNVLVSNINRHFMRRKDNLDAPITGQAILLYDTIKKYVENALRYDIEQIEAHGPITVIECEEDHRLKLNLDGTQFNFTFKADRVDCIGNTLRLIDYKTGSDPVYTKDINNLFDTEIEHRPKAILQLLLYAIGIKQIAENVANNATSNPADLHLAEMLKGVTHITPMIYKLTDITSSGAKLGKDKDKKQIEIPLDDFYNNETIKDFVSLISSRVKEIWDTNTAFNQVGGKQFECRYCSFKAFCRR